MASDDTLPLSNIRILDLTRVLAGPLCTMMLADLGARVIKIERPGSGDDTRAWGPPFDKEGRSAYFLSVNRNKLSVAADLNDRGDRDLILRMIAEADVVIDNFLPSALTARGIDPDAIVSRHQSLIWCTISGFGAGNPRPGYDFVTQAECGWMAITGEPSGEPMKVGVALADILAGKDAAIAVLAALVDRKHPRARRRITISLADSARAALINVAQNSLLSGNDARRLGNAHANIVPYQLFHAADRPIVIAVGNDSQWVACARALDLNDLAEDPALRTNGGRLAARERIVSRIEARLATAPAAEWHTRLETAGVPSGMVKTVLQALADTGASAELGIPSSVGGTARLRPPRLDQHGEEVRRLGWAVFDR